MDKLSPEVLMAYLDGELDQDKREAVETLLVGDAEAAAQLRRFAENDALLRDKLSAVVEMPVPQHLVDGVRNHRATRKIVPLPLSRRQDRKSLIWPKVALAAGVALLIGVFAGGELFRQSAVIPPIAADSIFQNTLESQPMGVVSGAGGSDETIGPMNTFLTDAGQVCREYERQLREQHLFGIACRDGQGLWQSLVEIDRTLLTTTPTAGADYAPAAGFADPLSAALAVLGAGKALTPAEEEQLMARGWR
jgi:hypothetical protein